LPSFQCRGGYKGILRQIRGAIRGDTLGPEKVSDEGKGGPGRVQRQGNRHRRLCEESSLAQIVFLYFLQKKGWLGVEKGRAGARGPKDFLRRLAIGEYGKFDSFFGDIWSRSFFDTLATDRGDEAWCSRLGCGIPFLKWWPIRAPG